MKNQKKVYMEFEIGNKALMTKSFTRHEVKLFSELSLDTNPLHLNEDYAKKNIFKRPICHGFLVGSLISAVIATKLPGEGSIYLDQSMKFINPVFWDDTITAEVIIKEVIKEKKIIILDTICTNQNQLVVIEGTATLKVPLM
jgi:3-hydroxybutyryl-CoA dehydratase